MELLALKCCLQCGNELRGRSDKKFCDDQCRSQFNNQHYAVSSNFVREINSILRRNRQILAGYFNGKERTKVNGSVLLKRGFDPDFITHTRVTKKGTVYRFCYEFGYRFLEGNHCMIVIVK